MAITAFQAEATNTGGEKFAIFKTTTDSFVYPIGFSAWGDSGSINVTSTSAPFPVTLVSGNSGIEVNAAISTASKIQVKNDSADAIFVRGLTSSAITISTDTTVTIAALSTASKIQVKNDSADAIFVRGLTNSAITISTDTTITITNPTDTTVTIAALDSGSLIRTHLDSGGPGYDTTNSALRVNVVAGGDANDTTVTISNDSADPIGVTNNSANAVWVQNDTGGPVHTQYVGTQRVGQFAAADSNGALQSFTGTISSVATTVTSSAGRLYGYQIGNPDTAGNVYLKVYQDDSAGVTLGTSSAAMDLFIPFGGGAVAPNLGAGIWMSSGISLAAAGGAGSTDHSAPSTSLIVTVWFAD